MDGWMEQLCIKNTTQAAAVKQDDFISIYRYGIKAIREIRRIEAISESPLFTHFTETMDGITTIRSHHKEDQFITVLHR